MMLRNEDRWLILWGGGLGDLLVIRPLILALGEAERPRPVYATTASHLPRLFDQLQLPVDAVRLSPGPRAAIRQLRRLGRFDRIYLGPRNTWRTRVLAHALRSGPILSSPRQFKKAFLADAVAAEIAQMGIAHSQPVPYGPLPLFPAPRGKAFTVPAKPYLLLHPGAKAGWRTKQWPIERWKRLITMLQHQDRRIHLVGTASERGLLERLLPPTGRRRPAIVHTRLELWELEQLVVHAATVICHNSGVMHMAAAHHRPTLVLTGSSAPYWRPPYPWVNNLSSGTCDLACNRYRCPVPGYHARCISQLSPDKVLSALGYPLVS